MLNKNDLIGQEAERVVRHIVLTQRLRAFYLRKYTPSEDPCTRSHDFWAPRESPS